MLMRPAIAALSLATTLAFLMSLRPVALAQDAHLPDAPHASLRNAPELESKIAELRGTLNAANRAKNAHAQAIILDHMGALYYAHADASEALAAFSQVLAIVRKFNEPATEATALCDVGASHFALGHAVEALDAYKEALPLWRSAGNKDHEAATLGDIAEVFRALHDSDEALHFDQRSLPLYIQAGNQAGEAARQEAGARLFHSGHERIRIPAKQDRRSNHAQ
jgi:tetratricopeptide (TPR) repeat protein